MNEKVKINIELIKQLLEESKSDIFVEDILGEKEIDEDSEHADMLNETFYEVKEFVIERLKLRLKFMELALEEQSKEEK